MLMRAEIPQETVEDDTRKESPRASKSWFRYGYFVRLPGGQLVPAGDSWALTPGTYKVGTSLGVKNGKEGIATAILTGKAVRGTGFDVAVIVEERDPGAPAPAPVPTHLLEAAVKAFAPPSFAPETIQTLWKAQNKRAVAIWNGVHFRPPTETFHEFLIEVPLKGAFGEAWYKQEIAKPLDRRHVVEQWLRAFRVESEKNMPAGHKPGQVYGAVATGATTELISLAHDLYMLQKVNRLPEALVARLRDYGEFQGARYEVAIAAAFVKCGFEISWVGGHAKHPEFVAINKRTQEEVAVETKSRRRPGVLHHAGVLPPVADLSADVDRLYREALQQDPGDQPFAIFLDVNLPPATPGEVAQWQHEIVVRWQQTQQQIALLGFTNFAWHYLGDEHTAPSSPEFILAVPNVSARPLRSPETLAHLQGVLNFYGICPNEY